MQEGLEVAGRCGGSRQRHCQSNGLGSADRYQPDEQGDSGDEADVACLSSTSYFCRADVAGAGYVVVLSWSAEIGEVGGGHFRSSLLVGGWAAGGVEAAVALACARFIA
jgi:hypothetical protein